MKKAVSISALLWAFVIAPPVLAAEAPPIPASDTAVATRMDAEIRSYVAANQFMGAVLVVKDGQVILDKGYGVTDLDTKTPITPDTRFYIGSITKQFTAASILLLEERGKLSTDDPISQYLPNLPAVWRQIPLRNLLTHTSGIPEFTSLPEVFSAALTPIKPDGILDYVRSQPLDFTTDSKFVYSNTNYILLGMIVEKVSGQSYADFIQKNILTPLHMGGTQFDAPLRGTKGYIYKPSGMGAPQAFDISWAYAAGGISSTTHDLLKWQQALFGGKILKPASFAKMTTPYKDEYGFGLTIHTVSGNQTIIDHSGQLPGFNATMAWYPGLNLSIVILENVEPAPPAPSAATVRSDLERILRGLAVEPVGDGVGRSP